MSMVRIISLSYPLAVEGKDKENEESFIVRKTKGKFEVCVLGMDSYRSTLFFLFLLVKYIKFFFPGLSLGLLMRTSN